MPDLPTLVLLTCVAVLVSIVTIGSTGVALAVALVFSFSHGLFQAAGLPLIIPKLIAELVAVLLFLKAFAGCTVSGRRLRTFGLAPIVGATAAGMLSGWIRGSDPLQQVLFIRDTVQFYLLFVALLNLPLREQVVGRLYSILIALFLLQLPVAALKAWTIGIEERWIGTVHWTAGELSVLVPLFATAFLSAWYLHSGRLKYVLLILLFAGFALAGEKRSAVFAIPMLFATQAWHMRFSRDPLKSRRWVSPLRGIAAVPRLGVLAMTGCVVFYVGVRTIPSLNPEEVVWGSFDIRHVVEYSTNYLNRDFVNPLNNPDRRDEDVQMGRWLVTRAALSRVVDGGPMTALFGYGAGAVNRSYLLDDGTDVMYQRFGLRGSTTGVARALLESGVLGALCILWFLGSMYLLSLRALRDSKTETQRALALGVLGLQVTFIFDYLAYSNASLLYGVLTPSYFLLTATIVAPPRSPSK